MKVISIHFKSESGDDYYFTVKCKRVPTQDEVRKWLFVEKEVDGGEEEWGRPWSEIPGAISLSEVQPLDTIEELKVG